MEAQFLFILIAIGAPIPGSLLGSYIADRSGGYKGRYQLQALLICVAFGSMAAMVGVFLFFIFDFYAFCFVLWLLMFLGAAMVPTCYGIIIASVEKDL